jgi:hypothetical protein
VRPGNEALQVAKHALEAEAEVVKLVADEVRCVRLEVLVLSLAAHVVVAVPLVYSCQTAGHMRSMACLNNYLQSADMQCTAGCEPSQSSGARAQAISAPAPHAQRQVSCHSCTTSRQRVATRVHADDHAGSETAAAAEAVPATKAGKQLRKSATAPGRVPSVRAHQPGA